MFFIFLCFSDQDEVPSTALPIGDHDDDDDDDLRNHSSGELNHSPKTANKEPPQKRLRLSLPPIKPPTTWLKDREIDGGSKRRSGSHLPLAESQTFDYQHGAQTAPVGFWEAPCLESEILEPDSQSPLAFDFETPDQRKERWDKLTHEHPLTKNKESLRAPRKIMGPPPPPSTLLPPRPPPSSVMDGYESISPPMSPPPIPSSPEISILTPPNSQKTMIVRPITPPPTEPAAAPATASATASAAAPAVMPAVAPAATPTTTPAAAPTATPVVQIKPQPSNSTPKTEEQRMQQLQQLQRLLEKMKAKKAATSAAAAAAATPTTAAAAGTLSNEVPK